MFFMRGIIRINSTIPKVEPKAEAVAEQPMAVFASPWRAMGYPSMIVAALGAVPGILNNIAVTDPMKVPLPTSAPNRSMTGSGSQLSVKGIAKAIKVTPLIPGMAANSIARSDPPSG